MRLLFVDDEPHLLASLRTMFRKRRKDWDMHFADGGQSAKALLEGMAFDVVVTDLRMAGVDGLELLALVKELQPHAARIVLTATTDLEVSGRALKLAHQILAKPCEAEELRDVVQATVATLQLLSSAELRRAAGTTDELPALPASYEAFHEALDQRAPLRDLVSIVERDPVFSANVLRLANSAYFGRKDRVTRIDRAVSTLGVDLLGSVLLQVSTVEAFRGGFERANLDPHAEQQHAISVADLAASLLETEHAQREARTIGVLHSIGKFVLACRSPWVYANVLRKADAGEESLYDLERRVFFHSHCEVGAYVLGLWGIPFAIVQGVLYHEAPSKSVAHGFGPLGAVHVANVLLRERRGGAGGPALDIPYLTRCGVIDRLDAWRRKAGAIDVAV